MKSIFATRRFSCLVQQVLHLCPLTIMTAVVAITLSQLSQATVVYTPANVVIKNSTYNLDPNNDGIADFTIPESEVQGTSCGKNLTASLNVASAQGNQVVGSGGSRRSTNYLCADRPS
jgi:hypothetical protein